MARNEKNAHCHFKLANFLGNHFYSSMYHIYSKFLVETSAIKEASQLLMLSTEQSLHFYYGVAFAWNLSYDETVKRGQYIRPYEYYRLEFETDNGGNDVVKLRWRHDRFVQDGELFCRGKSQLMSQWRMGLV